MSDFARPSQLKRSPRKLLLSFFGEFLFQERRERVRARAIIHALEGAGVKAPAARAALERSIQRGLLHRVKIGREVAYSLTQRAENMLNDAQSRVKSATPFDPVGEGWSVALFSLPDESQPTRYRLRSMLAWEGFAPYGRGAWIAPGEADFAALRAAMDNWFQADAVIAFRAQLAEGFSMNGAVEATWDVPAIAEAHYLFAKTWTPALNSDMLDGESPLALRTMLVADWLELIKKDPRLPRRHLPADWPAEASHQLFLQWQERLASPSNQELRAVLGE